jgi:hypothetical protein
MDSQQTPSRAPIRAPTLSFLAKTSIFSASRSKGGLILTRYVHDISHDIAFDPTTKKLPTQPTNYSDPLPHVHQTSYSQVRLHADGEPVDSGVNPLWVATSTIMGEPSAGQRNNVTPILNCTRPARTAPEFALTNPPSGDLANRYLVVMQNHRNR